MNTKKNNLRLSIVVACAVFLLLCGGMAFGVWHHSSTADASPYRLEVLQAADGGYGYRIYVDGHVVVNQPFIPCVAGKKPFHTEHDARKVGNLVIRKMTSGESLSVTKGDLAQLGVAYP